MTVSVRQLIQQRIDPTYYQPKAPVGSPPVAGPIDLLGAPPQRDLAWISEAARALSSAEAAAREVPYTPLPSSDARST